MDTTEMLHRAGLQIVPVGFVEAVRRHVRSFEPGTLMGSELNVAQFLRTLDGDIWDPWLEAGGDE